MPTDRFRHNGFNPRPRTVGDERYRAGVFAEAKVSIHAHVRWATVPGINSTLTCPCFNPRPRTVGDNTLREFTQYELEFQSTPTYGGRLPIFHRQLADERFQSTPTYGGRRNDQRRNYPDSCFNPRPRTVGDALRWNKPNALVMFQSTPTYGGRLGVQDLAGLWARVSIHAHVRWATGRIQRGTWHEIVSIHAHVRWATRCLSIQNNTPFVSIHAHVRWATRNVRCHSICI